MKTENAAELAKRQGLNTFTACFLVFLHVGAIAALFMFSWKALAVAAVLYYVTVGLGISMGYHRLHTHRSYRVPLWLEYAFATFGAMTLEGGPIFWVATHRMHHQLSDQPGDPHSPRDGAFWSHMGWILWGNSNHRNTKMLSKFYYATQISTAPPTIVCFVNKVEAFDQPYQRFLLGQLRQRLEFAEVPIRLIFRARGRADKPHPKRKTRHKDSENQ